jgi:hypothetical protein
MSYIIIQHDFMGRFEEIDAMIDEEGKALKQIDRVFQELTVLQERVTQLIKLMESKDVEG